MIYQTESGEIKIRNFQDRYELVSHSGIVHNCYGESKFKAAEILRIKLQQMYGKKVMFDIMDDLFLTIFNK